MGTLVIRHKVRDYSKWRPTFDNQVGAQFDPIWRAIYLGTVASAASFRSPSQRDQGSSTC